MFEAFLAAFSLVAISELGDRSQVAALLLGAKYHNNHKKVFLGAISAFALLFFISIVLSSLILTYLPAATVRIISAVAFLAMGALILTGKEEEKVRIKKDKEPFIASFTLIALSELGDKTQIAIIFLAAGFQDAAGTFAGAMLAASVLSGIAIFAGRLIAKRVKMHWIKYISGAIFILFGLASLLVA